MAIKSNTKSCFLSKWYGAFSVFTFNHNLTPSIANDADIWAAYFDDALLLVGSPPIFHRLSLGLTGWLAGWRCLFVATFFASLCFASCFYWSLNESRSDNRQLNPNIKGDEIKLNNKNILWSHNLYLCDNVLRFAEEWSKSKCCFIRLEYAQAHGKICFIHVSNSFIYSFIHSIILSLSNSRFIRLFLSLSVRFGSVFFRFLFIFTNISRNKRSAYKIVYILAIYISMCIFAPIYLRIDISAIHAHTHELH